MGKHSLSWTGSTTTFSTVGYPEYDNFGASKRGFHLDQVRLHSSAAGSSGTFTVSLVSKKGATYDVVLSSTAMTSVADVLYLPTRPIKCFNGDGIKTAWTNSSSATIGLEIVYRVD